MSLTCGVRTECPHYPCHDEFELEDCTFCYCPFYPCHDRSKGAFVTAKDGSQVWDCSRCTWIHKHSVVKEIVKEIDKRCRNMVFASE